MSTTDAAKYYAVSASGTVITGGGTLYGFIIANHTSGIIKVYDNTAQSGAVLIDTFTFTAGSSTIGFSEGISFNTGISITVSGTASFTVRARTNN